MKSIHTLLLGTSLVLLTAIPALAGGIPGPVMGDNLPGLIAALVLVAVYFGIRQFRRHRAQK